MVARVRALGLTGIRGYAVEAECFLSGGMPGFDVVGLPDAAVKESRERVRAAIKNTGYTFPQRRITVNLAPADTRKEGALYDLAILLGVLTADERLAAMPDDAAFLGELSLEGELRPITGVLSMALAAREIGITQLFVPADNAAEASLAEGLTVYAVKHVRELIAHLTGLKALTRQPVWKPKPTGGPQLDFREVRGQENVKRALEIAAAGSHNILLIGPPGAGKSMLARRLPSILPDLSSEEALHVTQIYSVAGQLPKDQPLMTQRPLRSPHHTASAAGLSGGGLTPKPGEISLAHHGVLFLDELPEFRRDSLEILRQPMEDGVLSISRATGTLTFPASFMLVAAMNPCRCGWYGHPSGRCVCKADQVKQYRRRISGPLLNRIDMHVPVPSVPFDDLTAPPDAESSQVIRDRVNAARRRQTERYGPELCNARLPTALREQYCTPGEQGMSLLRTAFERMGMTARSYDRVVKVARTIADLEGVDEILPGHLAEAIQYRSLDRKL